MESDKLFIKKSTLSSGNTLSKISFFIFWIQLFIYITLAIFRILFHSEELCTWILPEAEDVLLEELGR